MTGKAPCRFILPRWTNVVGHFGYRKPLCAATLLSPFRQNGPTCPTPASRGPCRSILPRSTNEVGEMGGGDPSALRGTESADLPIHIPLREMEQPWTISCS
jgi:hypothetical protein